MRSTGDVARHSFPGGSRFTFIRVALAASGTVAAVTGTMVAIAGSSSIPGGTRTSASNDSVMRFYAVMWAAQAPTFWRVAREASPDPRAVKYLCFAMFAGGIARVVAARSSGRPHPLFTVLTVVELILPPVLLVLRRRDGPSR